MADIPDTNMSYVRLGASGLKVSKIILGCLSYGSPEFQPWILGEEEGLKHIKYAYDAGINTFDTANLYSNGLSETILGNTIKKFSLPREKIVVMTKLYFVVGTDVKDTRAATASNPDANGFVNQYGLSRKNIFASVRASLERLQLDYVDVLQCHRFDYNTPIAETMQALHDVVQAGYARYIGMSACFAFQFHAMQNYAITNKLTPFISMQNHYNLVYREEEREMFPTTKMFGVGAIPYSPLARGYVARLQVEGTSRGGSDPTVSSHYDRPSNRIIAKRVHEVATRMNISMAQVALAWVMGKEGKSSVSAPVVGTTSIENLKDIIGAVNVRLTEEDITYLEEPYTPTAIVWSFVG